MERLGDLLMEYGPPIVGVIIFLVVANFLAKWIGRLVSAALERANVEKTLCGFLGSVSRWTLMVLAVIACLGVFSVETTSFAAVIAAGGLAIGLAFQGSLSNLSAGIMLMIFRPFKVTDLILVEGHLGKVAGITLFATQLDTLDNRRVIIPNRDVFGSTVENLTHHPIRRVDVSVGVEYKDDVDRTREVLEHAAHTVPGRLEEPAPQVILLNLGDSSVDWQVRVWCETDRYWDVFDAATRRVKLALEDADLHIPFPQMDVHFDRVEAPVH